jgi:hypothetical protein
LYTYIWYLEGKIEGVDVGSSDGSEGSEEDFVVGDTVGFEKGLFNNSNDGFNEGVFDGDPIGDSEAVAVSFNNHILVGEDDFTFDGDKDELIDLDKDRARVDRFIFNTLMKRRLCRVLYLKKLKVEEIHFCR